ncbi:hypothetical protein [Stenotrophomonas indicatrix]|uniref:hypothetical protein n=1 Tax=Stenotrophomonas indicatrix TaxID=2045451 RepID=UPI00215AE097|nr:hypothetical protein [Stenotrophomonas indicatrix]MCR8715431.1 hypothetical protein [Stenotrophomonas indicatrix]
METPLARNAAETGLMELKIAYLSDMQWTALHPAAGNRPVDARENVQAQVQGNPYNNLQKLLQTPITQTQRLLPPS